MAQVLREGRLGGVLGSFFWFWEVVLELILRLFRRPSAQQTEHAKSTFYWHSDHFGLIFFGFLNAKNCKFKKTLKTSTEMLCFGGSERTKMFKIRSRTGLEGVRSGIVI